MTVAIWNLKKSILQMMAMIFMFHGTGGTPDDNWFPWLKKELEERHHTVIVPALPSSDHPKLEVWMQGLQESMEAADEDTILIGHSLGGTLVLRILEKLPCTVRACFLVAPVSEMMGNDFDSLVSTFIDHPFDWMKIKNHTAVRKIFHADDDPYIPLSHARKLANNIDASLTVIAGGKHLNANAGFHTFPLLRGAVEESLKR